MEAIFNEEACTLTWLCGVEKREEILRISTLHAVCDFFSKRSDSLKMVQSTGVDVVFYILPCDDNPMYTPCDLVIQNW